MIEKRPPMKEYEQQEEKSENTASEPGIEYASAPEAEIDLHQRVP